MFQSSVEHLGPDKYLICLAQAETLKKLANIQAKHLEMNFCLSIWECSNNFNVWPAVGGRFFDIWPVLP